MAHSAADADHTVPAWFAPTMNRILAPTRILVAKTRNCEFGDGSTIPFQIVPFNDGSMPTEVPHNLPPLVNVAAIRALTARQTIAYADGYRREKSGELLKDVLRSEKQLDAQWLFRNFKL